MEGLVAREGFCWLRANTECQYKGEGSPWCQVKQAVQFDSPRCMVGPLATGCGRGVWRQFKVPCKGGSAGPQSKKRVVGYRGVGVGCLQFRQRRLTRPAGLSRPDALDGSKSRGAES